MNLRMLSRSLLMATSLLAFGAQAAEGLWPTALHWNPDACTSFEQVMFKEKSEFAKGVEVGRCLTMFADDKKSQNTCLSGAQSGGSVFLSNKCSDGWFISLNGIEYSLKKRDPDSGKFLSHEDVVERVRRSGGVRRSAPDLVGDFQEEGVSVRVTQSRLIKTTVDSTIAPPDDPVLDKTFAVTVEVRKGGAKKAFPAVLKANYK